MEVDFVMVAPSQITKLQQDTRSSLPFWTR